MELSADDAAGGDEQEEKTGIRMSRLHVRAAPALVSIGSGGGGGA